MMVYDVNLLSEGDMVCRSYRSNGNDFEPMSLLAWHAALRPGCVGVDVGAYTGLYSLIARKYGANCYAFEPHPANYERLLANVANNPGPGLLSVFNAAVGAEVGRADVYDLEGRPMLTSAGKIKPTPSGDTELTTIDALNLPRCDAIKIDVEGGEVDVLRGAARTIAGYLPRLIIEANSEAERQAIDAELSQYGYGPGARADVRNLIYVHSDR